MGNKCINSEVSEFSNHHNSSVVYSLDKNNHQIATPRNQNPLTVISKTTRSKHSKTKQKKKKETWTGRMKNGKKEGYGILHTKKGLRFEGKWTDDMLNGKGKMYCSRTGNSYEGMFKKNKFNGLGIFLWKDGTRYHGNWLDDQQHGYGEENNPDGSRYEGNYMNGRKHGKGIQHFCSGEVYIGEFSNDKLHGWGEYRWPDGKKYIGGWYNGLMNGEGELILREDDCLKRKIGVWSMGRLVCLNKEEVVQSGNEFGSD